MPFIRTSVHRETSAAQRAGIVQAIHEALIEAIGMPAGELFNMITSYESDEFFFSRTFNGYSRSNKPVVVEITMRRGRSDAMKRELYRLIAKNISESTSIQPSDIFIFTHENDYSDWSVGGGNFAMNIVQQVGAGN